MDQQQFVLNHLTTAEDSVFGEPPHYEFLLAQLNSADMQLRFPLQLWHAGLSPVCAAYNLALYLADSLGLQYHWKILSTGMDNAALSEARLGVFSLDKARRLPAALLKKYCLKGKGQQQGFFKFKAGLREKIEFRYLPLADFTDLTQQFDIIMLCNTLRYLTLAEQQQLISGLVPHLRPAGLLFVDKTDNIKGFDVRLQPVHAGCYRKLA